MADRRNIVRRKLTAFRRDEDGAATIEAVLWFLPFVYLLCLLIDASMIFHKQTTITRLLQNANRNMSIGRFDTTTEAEAFVTSSLAPLTTRATVSTSITAGLITTTVAVPLADLEIVDTISSISDASLTVTASHLMEF